MDDHQNNTEKLPKPFRILSIEKTDPPESVSGGEWYRYCIEYKASPIEGIRAGTLSSVKQHLEEYLEKLNARATLGYSAYAARKTKK